MSWVDGKPGEDGRAKIAPQNLEDPFAKTHEIRPVKAEALPDLLDVGRRRLIPGNDGRRITGRKIKQTEHEQRDESHNGDRRDDPADEKNGHVGLYPNRGFGRQAFATPQKNGSGPLVTPVTFFRQA